MKALFRISSIALLGMGAMSAAPEPLRLMPQPRRMVRSFGFLRIEANFRIAFTGPVDGRLHRAATRMISELSRQTGLALKPAVSSDAAQATLVVECSQTTDHIDRLGDSEAYRLDVAERQARLSAATDLGILRGMQTFLQLVAPGETSFVAPSVHIEDAPRFAWRGLLIDVTSHFMPVDVIERNLDAMEAVKLNVFHWHLTDDQGFRVESKVFPKLHELGSDGDYYRQDQIGHIIAYAHDRGIRIVPELDMPGHCASWLVGYPELASAPGPYAIIHTFGVYDPTLDPTREAVYQFVDKLIGEFAALFPDAYLHIGGDEVNGKQWKRSPAIQTFIREHGLKDEAGLQAYFNRRVEALVKKHGKKMMGWDEVLHPDLPHDIVVESWRDRESMAAAARRGYPVLLSFGYYLDHLDLTKTYYGMDPMEGPAKDLTPEAKDRILGGEACMWTEYVNRETIDSRIWPKTAAIAERLWSPAGVNDTRSMYDRLDWITRWLDYRGVRHNLNYALLLERLSPGAPFDALRTLADAVDPLGIDGREVTRRYTQTTPLNRLVDAARGDSAAVRHLERAVAEHSPDSEGEIRDTLVRWRDNDRRLRPALQSSFLLQEDSGLSHDLAELGSIGLRALDYLDAHKPAPESWVQETLAMLSRMEKPRAEVVLAAVRPVRMLVLAAGQVTR